VEGEVVGESRSNEGEPRKSRRRNVERKTKSILSNLGGAHVRNGLPIPQIDISPARTSIGQDSPM
jgi:hypothetical protein